MTNESTPYLFKRPTEQTRKRLANLMGDLAIAHSLERDPGEASVVGSLREAVDAIDSFLHRDDEQNTLESIGEPWRHDYVVRRDPGGALLQVMTRLSSPTKPGEIFYGCTVARLPDGIYAVWIDE